MTAATPTTEREPQWLDAHGAPLQVGDWVRLGLAEGMVLLLNDMPACGSYDREPGIYVTNLGYWGDCAVLAASRVTKIGGAA